jgi:putative membrane protein
MLMGLLASLEFINIIYSLSASFGDVGKAIGVLFMVIQVAGSGGTFPVEMLPKVFQSLYSFLPFVYSENAFRAAMFGTYGTDWLQAMGTLALYLVPALLLGLVLRKPLVPVNEWMEEKLEETKLM